MMTAQDYPSGLIVDQSGIDMCLVGDSLAMVSLGYDSTNPLTVEVRKERKSETKSNAIHRICYIIVVQLQGVQRLLLL